MHGGGTLMKDGSAAALPSVEPSWETGSESWLLDWLSSAWLAEPVSAAQLG